MKEFKFIYNEEEFILTEENFNYMESEDVEGFTVEDVLTILNEGKSLVDFDYEYYNDSCEECGGGKIVDKKHYGFLEYHFYIFSKENKYVISNISEEFEGTSYTSLAREKKIDDSHIVSVVVCSQCKTFSVEVEQCDM
ncbi:MAG: DUF3785 family protein [Clostridium sp.]|uniref:DUF3785 family protein n=1 Tax=Clostridium sp. TaxID=1506 RepID=UPI00304DE63F